MSNAYGHRIDTRITGGSLYAKVKRLVYSSGVSRKEKEITNSALCASNELSEWVVHTQK
jgi:hypothetical protein